MNALKCHAESRKKSMSPSQERMMMKEIKRQCAAYWEKHELELMAMILWQLHEQEGWGPKKMKKFFMGFTPTLEKLFSRYEMETNDEKFWICTYKLKEYGVDLEAWQHEDPSEEGEEDGIC